MVRWSPARKRYERRGVLVEDEALRRAEEECERDAGPRAEARTRAAAQREWADRRHIEQFARAIGERYPSCPPGEDFVIAEHSCRKYSGRVGRSAAAKRLDEKAIDLAVLAHVRHGHTSYDALLMAGWDQADARATVAEEIERILAQWKASRPASTSARPRGHPVEHLRR